MSESVRSSQVTVGTTPDEGQHPGEREVATAEFFHWIYRFFYSKTVGLILILLMAFYAVIGSVISQLGPDTLADSAQKAKALEELRLTYGGWTPILNALGFFHVFTSVGFYVVVAMLALSILACTAHRIPELWRRVKSPRLHVSASFFQKARYRGSVVSDADASVALDAARAVLLKRRFRVLDDPREQGRAIYADRYAWSGVGTVIAHLSFIIILVAFVISSTLGIEDDLAIPVGGEVAIGHGVEGTLHALSFSDTYTEEGRPADYVSVLQIRQGGEVVAEQEVRVNSPLDFGGFRFHQSTFGTAADVVVMDEAGVELFHEAVPLKWTSNDGSRALGRFPIPNTNLEVIVVLPASGAANQSLPAGTAVFEIYEGEEATPIDVVPAVQGEEVSAGDYRFVFERERQYTGIRMRHDPGAPWMWAGSILLVLGMSITFMFPYRRLWVRVNEGEVAGSEVLFGAVSRLDYSYQKMFEEIVGAVDRSLGDLESSDALEMAGEHSE